MLYFSDDLGVFSLTQKFEKQWPLVSRDIVLAAGPWVIVVDPVYDQMNIRNMLWPEERK